MLERLRGVFTTRCYTNPSLPYLTLPLIKFVKTVTGNLVNRFPTGNQFSERITGYRIYRTPT